MNKRLKSFAYAWKGIREAMSSEMNMKIHLAVCIGVTVCGFLFRITLYEWLACLCCFGLVFSAEMFNTAIEDIVDMISPEKRTSAGRVKDIAAGAVLVAAIFSAVVGTLIFAPKGWMMLLKLTEWNVETYSNMI
jgi:diacylglycerol kinase